MVSWTPLEESVSRKKCLMLLTHDGEVEKHPGLDSRQGHVLVVVEAKVRYESELKGALEVKKGW